MPSELHRLLEVLAQAELPMKTEIINSCNGIAEMRAYA